MFRNIDTVQLRGAWCKKAHAVFAQNYVSKANESEYNQFKESSFTYSTRADNLLDVNVGKSSKHIPDYLLDENSNVGVFKQEPPLQSNQLIFSEWCG